MFGTPLPGFTVGIVHVPDIVLLDPDEGCGVFVDFGLVHLGFLPVFLPLDLLLALHDASVSE